MIRSRPRSRRLFPLVAGIVAVLGLTVLASVGPVSAQDEQYPLATATDDLGTYLTGEEGRTLYFFTRDVTPGRSVCSGGCLEAWPPYLLEEGESLTVDESVTGVVGQIPHEDGTFQVTYDGRPLYYWQDDTAAGDTTGQGVGDVWFVALEDGSAPPNQPAVTLAATTTDLGDFLTDADGMTLYFFTNDTTPGASVCDGDCATNWPPLTVPWGNTAVGGEGVPGVVAVTPREDGSWQVTYDGRPLYYFAEDEAAGDTNGQGRGDVWFVALTDGSVPEVAAEPEGSPAG
jgi:predicted lipoprotein with Yx(FWY)xxD motif